MSDLEAYRAKAAAWCESVAPTFGKAARKGLSVEEDLALGRRYQKAKFDAGFAGINCLPTSADRALAISRRSPSKGRK